MNAGFYFDTTFQNITIFKTSHQCDKKKLHTLLNNLKSWLKNKFKLVLIFAKVFSIYLTFI